MCRALLGRHAALMQTVIITIMYRSFVRYTLPMNGGFESRNPIPSLFPRYRPLLHETNSTMARLGSTLNTSPDHTVVQRFAACAMPTY